MKVEELTVYEEEVFRAVKRMLPQLTGREAWFGREECGELLASDRSHLLVLREDDGRVAGMLVVALYPTLSGGLKAWIEDVVVDEACRGKGYGKELVAFAIGFARLLGVQSISLSSAPVRVAANRLYRSMGFVQRETNVYLLKL